MSRRKQVSKRRWKARYRIREWVPRYAVVNHRLETLVADGTWHLGINMVRRLTAYEAAGGWPRLSGNSPLLSENLCGVMTRMSRQCGGSLTGVSSTALGTKPSPCGVDRRKAGTKPGAYFA